MDPWFARTRVPEAIVHSPRETPGTGPVFTLQLLFCHLIYPLLSNVASSSIRLLFSHSSLLTMSDSSDQPRPYTQPVRRCATLPTKLRPRRPRSSESLRPSEDQIFFHPCAKIVHFAPRAVVPIPSRTALADFDYPVDTVETLPWKSPTERTVAFAPLRLQNLHGLTVFLKCGGVVHAILKNSQCWCVDGESTFVLRIRPLTYYRIELPNETENNEHYVLKLKDVLPNILRYEITPCPFKRGFTVEIPAEAKVPRRRRAWHPKGRRESAPVASTTFTSADSSSRQNEHVFSTAGDTGGGESFEKRDNNRTILEAIPDDNESLTNDSPGRVVVPRRSVTETPQSFQTLLAKFENRSESQADPDTSFSSSIDSFHSPEDSYTFPDSSVRSSSTAPSSVDHTELAHGRHYHGEESAETIFKMDCFPPKDSSDNETTSSQAPPSPKLPPMGSPESERTLSLRAVSEAPTENIPASVSPIDADLSTMSVQFRRRAKASTEREVSPMPPSSSLCRSNPSKIDTKSIIQKTCSVVLVPSVQLLLVLIHIAAHIVIGPAINSYVGNMDRRIEYHIRDPLDAVDDFDLPLEPDQSSDSQSREANKSDFRKVD